MLQVDHITKNFGDFRALDDVSLHVEPGRIFGLLGPNGAGKTTLIRIINRIIRPDAGSLTLDGRPITDDDTLRIGYMPEERGLYKKMRVGEQALYLAQLKGMRRQDAERSLREWFRRFEIESWWGRRVEELSKGMQQKVQFIVTVAHNPRLLIFDEPFSGFDPINATLLKDEILRLRDEGATVIFSTHNMSSVEEICDDIALINQSRLMLSGNVRQIRESFRQNRYHVEGLLTSLVLTLPADYRILSSTPADSPELSIDVELPSGATANDLLQLLLPQCQVRQMQEILPSMIDIFIRTVQQ